MLIPYPFTLGTSVSVGPGTNPLGHWGTTVWGILSKLRMSLFKSHCKEIDKTDPRLGENACKSYISLVSQTCKKLSKLNSKKTKQPSWKNTQEIWADFLREDLKMASKHIKKILSIISD